MNVLNTTELNYINLVFKTVNSVLCLFYRKFKKWGEKHIPLDSAVPLTNIYLMLESENMPGIWFPL